MGENRSPVLPENFGRRKPESRETGTHETVLLYNFGGCVGITVLAPPPQTPGRSRLAGCRGSGVLVHYITTAPERNEMRPLDGRTV